MDVGGVDAIVRGVRSIDALVVLLGVLLDLVPCLVYGRATRLSRLGHNLFSARSSSNTIVGGVCRIDRVVVLLGMALDSSPDILGLLSE